MVLSIAVVTTLLIMHYCGFSFVAAQTESPFRLHDPYMKFILEEGCLTRKNESLPEVGSTVIPWVVQIVNRMDSDNIRRCVGSLISLSHILTTAYCLKSKRPFRDRKVIKIYLNSLEGYYTPGVCSVYIHPKYRINIDAMGHVTVIRNNVGVLSLTEPFPRLRYGMLPQTAICLAMDRPDLLYSRTTNMISWGFFTAARRVNDSSRPMNPRTNRANIIHPELCLSAAKPEYFCVELPTRNEINDFCHGDDGGIISVMVQNRFVQYGMLAFPFSEKVCAQISSWVVNVTFHHLFIRDAVAKERSSCGLIETKFPNQKKYANMKDIQIN